jgi:hypothetical protein
MSSQFSSLRATLAGARFARKTARGGGEGYGLLRTLALTRGVAALKAQPRCRSRSSPDFGRDSRYAPDVRLGLVTAAMGLVLGPGCGGRTNTDLIDSGGLATDSGAPAEQDSGAPPEGAPEAGPDANVTCAPPMLLSMGVNGALMLASYSEACSNGATYRVDIQCANGSDITCTGPAARFDTFSPDDLCMGDPGAAAEAYSDCGYP